MSPSLTDRPLPERLPSWGVLVLESHHSPDFTMDWRTHDFVKVVYVLSGQGTFHLGKHAAVFSAGDVIVVAPGTRNRIVDDPQSAPSLYICCIAESLLWFDAQLSQSLSTGVIQRDAHFANRVASLLRRLVHTQEVDRSSKSIALVADSMKLIEAIVDRERKTQRSERAADERGLIQQYVDELPSRFYEETSIDDAAAQLGMPRRTFTKLFTETTGETWLSHVRRLAIEHAQRRLLQTDLPITSVAFECGFNDLSTFYRQFKRQCGVSPGKYRSSADSVQGIGSTDQ